MRSRSPRRSRVLLVPYSALGPFVGVFLDRWSRRNSLVVANRSGPGGGCRPRCLVWYGTENVWFILAALLVVALNRFFLAGLSAAQPHVVDAERLVTANSFATTAGTVAYAVALGSAGVDLPAGRARDHTYAAVAATAALGYALAAR